MESIDKLKLQIRELESSTTDFEKYHSFGMTLLSDLAYYFDDSPPEVQRKILGSIFPRKLTFQEGKCQTEAMNPAWSIIQQKTNGLGKEKPESLLVSEKVSGDVPMTGAFSNQFLERMRQIHELEPLITLKPHLTNQWGRALAGGQKRPVS